MTLRSLKVVLNVAVTCTLFIVTLAEAQTQPNAGRMTSFQLGGSGGSIQYPQGWSPRHYANMNELWNATPEKLAALSADEQEDMARIKTSVTPCADHAEALHRLREIEAEWGMTSTYGVVGGWPALQRRVLVPKPHEGAETDSDGELLVMVTTAVAAGPEVIRLDGFAPETASPAVINEMESMGRSLVLASSANPQDAANEVQHLRSSPSLRMPLASSAQASVAKGATASALPESNAKSAVTPGVTANLGTLDLQIGSESEIAVSSNGTNIVVAQQCQFRTSADGGATFPFGGGAPGNCTGGDSSVAFGKSGNFYWETIGTNKADCPTLPTKNCNNTQQIASSTNSGQSFTFSANVIDCLVTSGCGFGNVPDQEHIAADRVNASGTGQDQVYAVFRQGFGYGISCSTDSAATWSAVAFYNNGTTDFPRITVSQDGTVYVITNNGNNIELDSFSQCQNGLTRGLTHVTVASGINQVTCPVSGLDRCNNGNILSSHTVAVDDTNANHLYASYAVNTVAPPANASFPGNENVLVEESTDGGAHWSSAVQINQGTAGTGGRRFQPWVCVTGGTAFVSWFDRRASISTANDLTDYYSSSAFDSGGTLTAGTDFRINGAADPECASGWPCQSRSPFDSESCSTQPQLGGICRHTPNNATDSKTPCNFASPVCPATETCQTGGGCPKYADYTGNACLLGRLYNAWPSATNQPGAAPISGNIASFFTETVVGATPTTTTYTGPLSGAYLSTATLTATLVLNGTSVPVSGQTITITLGAQSCMGTTNSSGVASCNITLTQAPGPYPVQASFAGSGNYMPSSSASATFLIVGPPAITKSFAPNKIVPGGTTTVTLSITNPNPITLTGVGFTDTLPLGLLVASPNGLSSTCGGTTIATAGSGIISLTGAAISATGACSISVTVTAAVDGIYKNTTSPVTSNEGGTGNTASATVIVARPPTIAKMFSALAIPPGGSATLTFTITNPNTVVSLTGISFTDTLPAGLKVSTPNGLSGTCGGGGITATAGSGTITLIGAALSPGASCAFSVGVTASATGALVNMTDPITSDQTIPGNPATAMLTVGEVFEVSYAANLNLADSVINITNSGENGASPDGPGFGSPAGNLCVNVYAFAAEEQLISCCSCLVTPNGLVSLSIQSDILNNPAVPVQPNSIVVKLVSTLAGGAGSGTSCSGTAGTPGVLASGLLAWDTTVHALPSGGYVTTEIAFAPSTLSLGELNSITNRCSSIIGNNSGYGICNSCQPGGSGAKRF